MSPPSGGVNGADGTFATGGGGGGGGSAGRIRVNSCTSLANLPSAVSPAISTGSSCDNLLVDGFES